MDEARLNHLLAELQQADSVEALQATGRKISESCEFEHFSYAARIPTSLVNPQTMVINGYPEAWQQHYLEQGFQQHDPTIHHCLRSVTPLIWSDLRLDELPPQSARVMLEARDFDLISGVSCSVRSAGGEFGIFSIASGEPDETGHSQAVRALPELNLLTAHYHEALRRIVPTIELPQLPALSSREKECLLWSSEGKTSWEISQILSIAERTVIFHLQNAADKLQASNRQHAVARAISLGLISPHLP